MKTATTVVHMTLRVSGLLLILLGLAIWTGRVDQVIPVHEFLGFVLVLSLWMLAYFGARAGVPKGMVAAAVAWGLIAPILGLTQANLLDNNWHWVIQVVHLLGGLAAIGTGEGLAQRMKRLGAPQAKGAGATTTCSTARSRSSPARAVASELLRPARSRRQGRLSYWRLELRRRSRRSPRRSMPVAAEPWLCQPTSPIPNRPSVSSRRLWQVSDAWMSRSTTRARAKCPSRWPKSRSQNSRRA